MATTSKQKVAPREDSANAPAKALAKPRTAQRPFPRWMVAALVVALLLPWTVVILLLVLPRIPPAGNPHAAAANSTATAAEPTTRAAVTHDAPASVPASEWKPGKAGPWGQIETKTLILGPPDDSVLGPPGPPVRWFFPKSNKEKALATLREAGLAADKVKWLAASAKWNSDGGVISVEPGDEFVLAMPPRVRAALYASLCEFPQNRCIDPVCFPVGGINEQLEDSGLAEKSTALFKRLLYPVAGRLIAFADGDLLLRCLPDDAERTRFMCVLLRTRTMLARLRLAPDTDIEKLAEYWGIDGRRGDLLPLLGALERDNANCNLVYLLPTFVREHLYRHPADTADARKATEDCFWSAYRFFDTPGESRDDSHSTKWLNDDCRQIATPDQLGDIMVIFSRDRVPLHAAVFIADDIYFTKNGISKAQPWVLMRRDDLLSLYLARLPKSGLEVHFFRRKHIADHADAALKNK